MTAPSQTRAGMPLLSLRDTVVGWIPAPLVPREGTMKKIALLLTTAMLLMLGNAPMAKPGAEITLDASQVVSAVDIEQAIEAATGSGTHPGTVTLDSVKGEFFYTADDRSINIFHSNVTLRSKNKAVIANCGDGVFFDDTVADNIVIEGIEFRCEGSGVAARWGGVHRNVTVRNNTFKTVAFAIEARDAAGWNITGNHAVSEGIAIHLIQTSNARVTNNGHLEGTIGVFLETSTDVIVSRNTILNGWQGVLIGWGSSDNFVNNNRILSVQQSGISFEGNNEYNTVLANKVSCKPGAQCRIVNLDNPPLSRTNKIRGNKLVK